VIRSEPAALQGPGPAPPPSSGPVGWQRECPAYGRGGGWKDHLKGLGDRRIKGLQKSRFSNGSPPVSRSVPEAPDPHGRGHPAAKTRLP